MTLSKNLNNTSSFFSGNKLKIDIGDYRLVNLCFFIIFSIGLLYCFFLNVLPSSIKIASSYEGLNVQSIGLTRAFNSALNGNHEEAMILNNHYFPALLWVFFQCTFRGFTLLLIRLKLVCKAYIILDILMSSISFIIIFHVFVKL
jgi:hypothetical protein